MEIIICRPTSIPCSEQPMSDSDQEFLELQRQLNDYQAPSNNASPVSAEPPPSRTLTCPSCEQPIQVLEQYVGRYWGTRIECTLCNHVFRASERGQRLLQAKLKQQAESQARIAETAQSLERLEQTEVPESSATDDAAESTNAVDLEPAPSYETVDHSWPYDHHRHPQGVAVKTYFLILAYSLLVTAGCWALLLLEGTEALADAANRVASGTGELSKAVMLLWACVLLSTLSILLLSGTIGVVVSHGKGRPRKEGFLFGLFLGPIGWLLAGLMPNHTASMNGQRRATEERPSD